MEVFVRKRILALLAPAFVLASAPGAHAAGDTGHGLRGWGPRVGLASDPDQLVFGAHFDAGRFAPRVRFQPDVSLGVGDHFTILNFTAPAHYRFPVNGDIKPYAGGGVTLGFVHWDSDGHGDNDDLEAAIDLVGGAEWQLRSGNLFFVEFDLLAGDLQDFVLVAGWTFR
jgi:opacity protein-like surface antigen